MSAALHGRVAIVTGSSRGIGRAFALRLAAEGADVAITGKSDTETERLPGTIHSVANEVRAQGRRALALKVDVRDEDQVRTMVERTVDELGGVDILVNNAGALWWERVLETPPKRVALMYEVNLRAAYLASYYALPHMVSRGWGHIVMNSPPVRTGQAPGFAMYHCFKMGMSRLAVGVAEEHRGDNVAANSLWPATPIDSLATRNWPADKMGRPEQWRTAEIMCDALMEILRSEPSDCTGRQLIDEAFLRERGWTDERINRYWLTGRPPAEPLWIDGRL